MQKKNMYQSKIFVAKQTVQLTSKLFVDITLTRSLENPKCYDADIEWKPEIPKEIEWEYVLKYQSAIQKMFFENAP